MDIDLELLDYLTAKGMPHIEAAVEGTGYLPRTVRGVAIFLLDRDGNVDLLTAKQQVTYDRFLKPLLFDVPCQGNSGPETCRGNGLIGQGLLEQAYRGNDFRCAACRGQCLRRACCSP